MNRVFTVVKSWVAQRPRPAFPSLCAGLVLFGLLLVLLAVNLNLSFMVVYILIGLCPPIVAGAVYTTLIHPGRH